MCSVGEGAAFSLQGAALRVVSVKPAEASFQGTRGDGLPFNIRPEGHLLPPVSYVDTPSFNSKYLMIVPQKRLKTSALFLQEPQGFLPQQPCNLAHRKAASLVPVTAGSFSIARGHSQKSISNPQNNTVNKVPRESSTISHRFDAISRLEPGSPGAPGGAVTASVPIATVLVITDV